MALSNLAASADRPRTVVADATPIHYLVLIGEIDLLRDLYGGIVIPNGVVSELSMPQTPAKVRAWFKTMPPWIQIGPVPALEFLPFPSLGQGERGAIWLASQAPDSFLLSDDRMARQMAESVGIQTVPTLRVLSTAAALSLVDLQDALYRLLETNFRVSPKLIDSIRGTQP